MVSSPSLSVGEAGHRGTVRPPWQDSLRSTELPIADEVLKGRNYFRNLWISGTYPRVPIQRQALLHGGPEHTVHPALPKDSIWLLFLPVMSCGSLLPRAPKRAYVPVPHWGQQAHLPLWASILTWPCPTTTCFLTKPTSWGWVSLPVTYTLSSLKDCPHQATDCSTFHCQNSWIN